MDLNILLLFSFYSIFTLEWLPCHFPTPLSILYYTLEYIIFTIAIIETLLLSNLIFSYLFYPLVDYFLDQWTRVY